MNTGKILAVIGIIISSIYFIFTIYIYTVVGEDGMKDFQQNLIEKMKQQEEQ